MLAERPDGLDRPLLAKMDHLVCFMPGTIALGATRGQPLSKARQSSTWSRRQEEEIQLAKELMKTCWATYLATATGLAPEITYFKTEKPAPLLSDVYPDSALLVPPNISRDRDTDTSSSDKTEDHISRSAPLEDRDAWISDIELHAQDTHNLQRPETIESLLYMYRITGDDQYREWGWKMFKSFVKHTAVVEKVSFSEYTDVEGTQQKTFENIQENSAAPAAGASSKDGAKAEEGEEEKASYRIMGFTSLSNCNIDPAPKRDNMESFWMAETLKYFYLLFSDPDFIPLEDVVFNTEAHVFPRFKTGGDLKTGWTRKARGN